MRPTFSRPQREDHSANQPGTAPRSVRRSILSRLLGGLGSTAEQPDPHRGRLMLEPLEGRQMMAGDTDLLFTSSDTAQAMTAQGVASTVGFSAQAEGEAVPDLVAFAKALDAAGVQFFGAAWCPFCTEQKQLFQDGGDFLPFIEVTGPNRQLNAVGTAEGIQTYPTWEFPDGTRLTGVQSLATLSQRSGVAIPQSQTPSFAPIAAATVQIGSPLHIPVDAYDPNGSPITITVTVDDPNLLEATVLQGNRSIRIDMEGFGDMVFELFEDRAPVPAGRVIQLANQGFYDGIIFHRVVDNFVIQAGDPTGTGTSGSSLPNFSDQFHRDLQHNRSGILSFAKTSDDTNNSQFFITEVPTRHLDFNHSIFGQLVEGDDVREAISEMELNSSGKPTTDIKISSIDVFNDNENSVFMLKAKSNATGTTNVRVTATNATGQTFTQVVPVTVAADTANSQPFLNPITAPAPVQNTGAATLQLSSVDVEGDAVTYFASNSGSTTNATVTVNATTGLVTVTPLNNFVGTVNVQVGVRPGAGVTGNATGDSDTESVAFRFEGEQGSTAPTGVDLLAASDSGASSTDNVTNAGSLTFTVAGVTSGATVELVRTGTNTVVGTGVATGSTINITTNNIAALGDGTYSIAARQRVGTVTSSLSPTLSLVYDSTAPASVVGSASTQGNVGRAYSSDLISPEEGNGLRYAFTASPTGATINAETGLISWTPTAMQTGTQNFTLSLTDAAGNVRTESFAVAVGGSPLAEIRLRVTDLQGNAVSNVNVGDTFILEMIGVDTRAAIERRGLFAAAADVLFNSALVQQAAGSSIEYGPGFTTQRGGVFTTGLIDELGAARTDTSPTDLEQSLIAKVRMTALAAGNVNIRSEPADAVNSEVLLYLVDNQIEAENVAYGSVALAIGQGTFTARPDTATVAEDSAATVINVLANDTTSGGTSTGLTVTAVTQPTTGGAVTLANGQVSFTPTANFSGSATFTYTVSQTGGGQQTASVTVTVTPVNDPPTGAADTFTVQRNAALTALDVLANDSIAPDTGETLRITRAFGATAGGTIAVNTAGNRVNYTPASGFTGVETFSYTVSDGTLTRDVQVTVTVQSGDAGPTAVNDTFTVTEDAAEAPFDVTTNDTRDTSNQTFALDTVGTPSQGGTATLNAEKTRLLYRPRANFNGTETVTYTIRDTGGGFAVGTVTFTVTSVNDPPPTASPTKNVSRTGGETVVLSTSDLPANVDANETLTFTVLGTRSNGGAARISTDGSQIFYTPPSATFTGVDTFTFTVRDSNNTTSTGTITVRVNAFSEVDVVVTLTDLATGINASQMKIVGTNALGETVSMPLVRTSTGASFPDLLPGSYEIEVPAIPFLVNGATPQRIPVTVPTTTTPTPLNITPSLGTIRAEYLSASDWFFNAPKKNILAAVAPGQSHVFASLSTATDTIRDAVVTLDATGNNVTITGRNSGGTNVSATIPTTGDRRVETRGRVGEMRLFSINLESTAVTFNPVSTSTAAASTQAAATSGGEGEQAFAASALASASPVISVEMGEENREILDESTSLRSLAIVAGDSFAEGESDASESVTVADLFVPVLDNVASTDNALAVAQPNLATSSSDVDTETEETEISTQNTRNSASYSSTDVDSAMNDVLPKLEIRSSVADQVAESSHENSGIDTDSVDEVLKGNLEA